MHDTLESLLTADSSGSSTSVQVWDWRTGGCVRRYVGGGTLHQRCLAVSERGHLILGAESGKPLIHTWLLQEGGETGGDSRTATKSVCGGPVNALAISADGRHCAAVISGTRLHLWQLCSGRLLCVTSSGHLQPVTVLRFADGGSLLLSAGEDGALLAWNVAELVQSDDPRPLLSLTEHALPVTDLICTGNGADERIISVSADGSLNIHSLSNGTSLLSVTLDIPLTTVAAAAWGGLLFAGATNGSVHRVSLTEQPRGSLGERVCAEKKRTVMLGHEGAVTTLALSMDGLTLASGAADKLIVLWHVPSAQRISTIELSGPVTSLIFITATPGSFHADSRATSTPTRASLIPPVLQRSLTSENAIVPITHLQDVPLPFAESILTTLTATEQASVPVNQQQQLEVDRLKLINAQLYKYMLDRILTTPSSTGVSINGSDSDTINLSSSKQRVKKRKISS